MATTEISLTQAWQEVATGEGKVVFTTHGGSAQYCVGDGVTAPTLASGHVAMRLENVKIDLGTGEVLFVKGTGLAIVTTTLAPVEEPPA